MIIHVAAPGETVRSIAARYLVDPGLLAAANGVPGDGALAQGRTDCGALEVGSRADIVVYDLDKPHLQPVYEALPNLFYAADASDVCLNMIDGEVVYRDGVLTRIDEEKVMAEARSRSARILSEL